MRILITRYPYESQLSGEEWHTITLAEGLRMKGHWLGFSGGCRILAEELAKRGFFVKKSWGGLAAVSKKAVLLFPLAAPFIFLNFLRILLYFKRKKRIDTVYMQSLNEKLLMTPLALLLGLKVIWVEHARIGRWLLKNPFLFLYKIWSKKVKVICVSREQSMQLGWARNLKVIVNGIDTGFFKPFNQDREKFWPEHNFAVTEKEFLLGTVARLYRDKGIDMLIRAFAKLMKRGFNGRLAIVGKGPEKEYLLNLSEKYGLEEKIAFLGELPRAEMPKFYNGLDLFVLPSTLHDPFGLVAAEAMACKKPVIVTRVCGIADELTDYHDSVIIEPNDAEVLATTILSLSQDSALAHKIAEAGHALCRERFSLSRMVKEYESFMMEK